jgi:4-hydroxy-tetrahydrodipicolinate reductase
MLLYVKKHMPNIPIVIGTTGLSKIHIDLMENCSYFTPIFHAPNMSFVVSLINTLLALVAKILPSQEFDTEISEVHHKLKKDAPSGTALMFGKTIAEVRGDNFLDVANFIRYGIIDQRKTGEIGFSVQRCGRVIGKHKVSFVGNHENISIIHEAHSKEIYAVGAIHAAEWTYKQKPGLYDMRDLTKDAVLPIIKEMCEDLE